MLFQLDLLNLHVPDSISLHSVEAQAQLYVKYSLRTRFVVVFII